MRATAEIKGFHNGLVSNPDSQDVPIDACTDCDSIDLDGQGTLRGIYSAGSNKGVAYSLQHPYAWIKKLDNTYILVYRDGSNIKAVKDFYGTPVNTFSNAGTAYSMTVRGQGVSIGRGSDTPKWVGYIDHGQFGGSISNSLRYQDAECKTYSGTGSGEFSIAGGTTGGSTATFVNNYVYQWAYSLVYDNLQESPLCPADDRVSAVMGFTNSATEYFPIVVTAKNAVTSPSSFNPRISGVNIYRAEGIAGNLLNLGFFKLIKSIDINANDSTANKEVGWTTSGNDKIYTYYDYGGATGASYEDNSGIPETATTTMVKYTFSADVNDYHFVGKCYVDNLPDAGHMVFRSKPFRYDTFDWANEYIKLPRVPTAMKGYNGKLFVWDSSTMYVINAERFYVMDSLDGAGASATKSVKATPYGLFFANSNSAYVFNSQVEKISEPIKDLWQAETVTPEVNYDEKHDLVLFHFGKKCYYYHVRNKTWGYSNTFHTGFTGGFQGKDGETYSCSSSSTVENFGSDTRRAWDWTSKDIDLGSWQDKKFYYLTVDSTGTVTPIWGVNGNTPNSSMINTTELRSDWETTGTTWADGKTINIKLTGSTNSTVRRVELIGRTLRPVTDSR